MKIKYYLRGLATGLVAAAILMALAARGQQSLSDEQIKERAAKLGMVMAGSNTLAQVEQKETQPVETEPAKQDVKETQAAMETEPESQAGKETEEVIPETDSVKETEEIKESSEPESKETESKEPEVKEPEKTPEPVPVEPEIKEPEKTPEPKPVEPEKQLEAGEKVSITIYKGNGSNTAARYMQEAGLVTSATDFDKYLCSNGYDKKICVGVFEIPAGSTYEEIAKIITTRVQ